MYMTLDDARRERARHLSGIKSSFSFAVIYTGARWDPAT